MINSLKLAKQVVFDCSEFTPPDVKYSKRNMLVGSIALKIDKLIEMIKSEKKAKKTK